MIPRTLRVRILIRSIAPDPIRSGIMSEFWFAASRPIRFGPKSCSERTRPFELRTHEDCQLRVRDSKKEVEKA